MYLVSCVGVTCTYARLCKFICFCATNNTEIYISAHEAGKVKKVCHDTPNITLCKNASKLVLKCITAGAQLITLLHSQPVYIGVYDDNVETHCYALIPKEVHMDRFASG